MTVTFAYFVPSGFKSSNGNKSSNGKKVPMATKVSMATKVPMATKSCNGNKKSNGNKSYTRGLDSYEIWACFYNRLIFNLGFSMIVVFLEYTYTPHNTVSTNVTIKKIVSAIIGSINNIS